MPVRRDMGKKGRLFRWCLVLVLVLMAVLAVWGIRREAHWRFQESDRSIDNPDRGFYIQVKSSRPHRIADAAEEVRVILLAYDLEGYGEGDLPQEKLEELRTALETAEQQHVAVVFRAAYGFKSQAAEPAQIERIGRHIEQMAEILNEHQEQILVVQAGMLGAYGEWHSSRYLEGSEEEKRDSRLYVLGQWEDCLDSGIAVSVRRQRFVREAMEAGILEGRLGIHNDALLSTDSDMGTYDDPNMGREEELLWSEELLSGQVNGGEMPTPGMLNEPENADYEFGLLHLSYLNLKYNKDIIARWSEQTLEGMEAKRYLGNHLGCRLFLAETVARQMYFTGELSGDGTECSGVEMQVTLCNAGYAALPEKYRVYVVLAVGEEQVQREVEAPELYLISNGQSATVDLCIDVPKEFLDRESVRSGEEMVTLGLKIAPGQDSSDGRDCLELANDGFSYKNGVNGIAFLVRGKRIPFLWSLWVQG